MLQLDAFAAILIGIYQVWDNLAEVIETKEVCVTKQYATRSLIAGLLCLMAFLSVQDGHDQYGCNHRIGIDCEPLYVTYHKFKREEGVIHPMRWSWGPWARGTGPLGPCARTLELENRSVDSTLDHFS
jgi:hypothetical protein